MFPDEHTLQQLWKHQLLPESGFQTLEGEPIEIIAPGLLNVDAGPDFSDAKIKIGNTLWCGTVEIHVCSSDWLKHKHQQDKAYDNVILHVVWKHDKEIVRSDGTELPVLELKKVVDKDTIAKIAYLKDSEGWIACESQIKHIDQLTVVNWMGRLLIERLEYKTKDIERIYEYCKGSWEDTFYILIASSFGFKVNKQPFEMLAKHLPQKILSKYKQCPLQLEALILGVAGFLEADFKDDYPNALKQDFQFLKQKHQITPLDAFLWKFHKTRPDNFPIIRLVQFTGLVQKSSHLFSKLLEIEDVRGYRDLFVGLQINEYWQQHYHLDKTRSHKVLVNLGKASIDNLLINAIAPMLFFYGKLMGNNYYTENALKLLQDTASEKNHIINGFLNLGVKAYSSFDSQALIHLNNFYCNQKKCLNCAIGIKILKQ